MPISFTNVASFQQLILQQKAQLLLGKADCILHCLAAIACNGLQSHQRSLTSDSCDRAMPLSISD